MYNKKNRLQHNSRQSSVFRHLVYLQCLWLLFSLSLPHARSFHIIHSSAEKAVISDKSYVLAHNMKLCTSD